MVIRCFGGGSPPRVLERLLFFDVVLLEFGLYIMQFWLSFWVYWTTIIWDSTFETFVDYFCSVRCWVLGRRLELGLSSLSLDS